LFFTRHRRRGDPGTKRHGEKREGEKGRGQREEKKFKCLRKNLELGAIAQKFYWGGPREKIRESGNYEKTKKGTGRKKERGYGRAKRKAGRIRKHDKEATIKKVKGLNALP